MYSATSISVVPVLLSTLVIAACAPMRRIEASCPGVRPIVIAHRGASGHRPEHTLAAYELAIDQGADYIEPDLVITSDGVLVARHEHALEGTTDVATRFPDRRTTKVAGGDTVTGWFSEDFTSAELKLLRARERLPTRSRAFDGRFEIPTFDEILELVARKERETGRRIGVYPETKSPSWFRSIGLSLEEPLVSALGRHGLDDADAPVFIQSFEVENLRRLSGLTRVRLIQLLDVRGAPYDSPGFTYDSMSTAGGLATIRTYADGIGPHKERVIRTTPNASPNPSTLVSDAQARGLVVHVWTLRSDRPFLPSTYSGDASAEYQAFRRAGVDGVFTDFPDHAIAALRTCR
ncbi:MAG: glycerophosphodiester phosphodiesterase [Gemmatimonadota bacterium]